jgi:hypothetical protein
MLKIVRWLLYLLLLSGAASGGFTIARWPRAGLVSRPQIPAEVRAQPGRLAVIHADSPAPIRWHRCASAHDPDVLILDDGKTVIVVAAQPGRYELFAWSAAGNQPTEAAQCSIIVEAASPPDALVETLRVAWAKEVGPLRLHHRDTLIRIYRQAADELTPQISLATLNQLYSAIRRNAQNSLPDDALVATRTAIGEALRQRLPTVDGPLTEELRHRCAESFRAIAAALDQLEVISAGRCVNCR